MRHFRYSSASTLPVRARPDALFAYLDDHRNLSSHMEQRSWAMMGSSMMVHVDERGARSVGSRFGLTGSFLGIPLAVNQIVTEREPPHLKAWTTAGEPTLWVIGPYRMGFSIVPHSTSSLLTVFIGYDLPRGFATRLLGRLLGGIYAKWCTRRMTRDAARHFSPLRVKTERSDARSQS